MFIINYHGFRFLQQVCVVENENIRNINRYQSPFHSLLLVTSEFKNSGFDY